MTARLLSLWGRINASYWFYPALFSILAFVLSLLTVHADRTWAADLVTSNSPFVPSRPSGARTMLQVIAGSMIGVAATVFSITIAAVAYASGTYGPRLLTNFMEDKGNQLSLATFIGTFVYSIMVLRVVRSEDEAPVSLFTDAATEAPGFVPQMSLLVATLLMLASIAVLVFFLNHIPSSIRINTVLEKIGKRLAQQIRDRFPTEDIGKPERSPPLADCAVHAAKAGYIEIIDFDGLDELAEKHECDVVLDREAGDFVHPGVPLLRVTKASLDDDADKAFRDCFVLTGLRTPTQDLRFLLDELVEIALRALSPGINDPFTAMTALHWLGAATAELAKRDLGASPNDTDKHDPRRVFALHHDFRDYVETGFGAARMAVASSPKAAIAMIDALERCTLVIRNQKRLQPLVDEADRLLDQAASFLSGPALAQVHERHRCFRVFLQSAGRTERSG